MIMWLSYLLVACLLQQTSYAQSKSPSTFIRGVCKADDGTLLCVDLPHGNNGVNPSTSNTTGHVQALATADGGMNILIRLYGLPHPDLILTAWLVWVSPKKRSTIKRIFDTVAHRSSPCAPFTASFGNGLTDQGEPNQLVHLGRQEARLNVTLNFNPTYPLEGPLARATTCLQRDIPGIQSTLLQQFPVTANNATTFIPTSSDYLRVYDPATGFEQLDAVTGKPVVARSPVAAAGIEVISHLDGTTHGISPGVNGVNQHVIMFFPFDNNVPIEYTAPPTVLEPSKAEDPSTAVLVPLPPAPHASPPVRGPEPEFSAASSVTADVITLPPSPTTSFIQLSPLTPSPTLEPSDAPQPVPQPTPFPIAVITNPPFPVYSRNHQHSHSSNDGHDHDHDHDPQPTSKPTKVPVPPRTPTPTQAPVPQPTPAPTTVPTPTMITNPPFPVYSRNHEHSHGSDSGHTHNRQRHYYYV